MPTAVLTYVPVEVVSTENIAESDWLNYRRTGIGGSDVAAVMGVSPFITTRDLYYDKSGIKPMIDDESNWVAKKVGHLLEDLVAEIFVKKTGYKVFKIKKIFRHPLYGFMVADVDYFVELPGGKRAILECKTGNYNTQEKWANGAVPINYEYQGRHYMSVMNLDTVFFACLFGNNENEFVWRKVERDIDQETAMIEQEQYFWEEYVLKGVEPPYTESGDLVLESIRRHYGEADEAAPLMMLNASFAPHIAKYLELREQKSALAQQVKSIEDQMKRAYAPVADEMGTFCKAECRNRGTVYTVTYNPAYRTAISKDKLEKLEINHPVVYGEYVDVTESRRFSVKVKESA
jgi:putative phage-type endonuclease